MAASATDSLLSGLTGVLPGLIQGGANYVGANNAASDVVAGNQNAIGTQLASNTAVQGIYGSQAALGNQADSSLTKLFGGGASGAAPDYSGFENSPGYQFQLNQGTKAINAQASATGNLYTPQTLNAVGQYQQGVAGTTYNNYVTQLMSAAGLGGQANAGLANSQLTTGNNISQAQINQGSANASAAASNAGTVGTTLSGLTGPLASLFGSGANASGALSGIGSALSGVGSLFNSGSGSSTPYSTYNPVTGAGTYTGNNAFDQYSGQTGYDPTTGSYNTQDAGTNFSQFAQQGGYDPVTGDFGTTPDYSSLFSNP